MKMRKRIKEVARKRKKEGLSDAKKKHHQGPRKGMEKEGDKGGRHGRPPLPPGSHIQTALFAHLCQVHSIIKEYTQGTVEYSFGWY